MISTESASASTPKVPLRLSRMISSRRAGSSAVRAQPIGGVGQTVFMQRARDQHRRADRQHARPASPAPQTPRTMAKTRPAARPTPAPMNGSTGSTSASCQRGDADIELEPGEERGLLLEGLQPLVERRGPAGADRARWDWS